MDGFKNSMGIAEVRGGNETQPADQARTQIGDDVAVKILEQQHVEGFRPHYKLHASVVNNALFMLDFRKLSGRCAGAAQEKAVAHLHDVGLVDDRYLPAPMPPGKVEGEPGNP